MGSYPLKTSGRNATTEHHQFLRCPTHDNRRPETERAIRCKVSNQQNTAGGRRFTIVDRGQKYQAFGLPIYRAVVESPVLAGLFPGEIG